MTATLRNLSERNLFFSLYRKSYGRHAERRKARRRKVQRRMAVCLYCPEILFTRRVAARHMKKKNTRNAM